MEKKSLFHWTCCWWSLLLGLVGSSSFRRCPPSRRNLIVAGVCFVYLFFVVSQVGYRRVDKDNKYRLNNVYNNLYNLGLTAARPEDPLTGGTRNNAGINDIAVPTLQSNVVYITLRSNKRLKPAVIRGTVKPKLRRKARRNKTDNNDAFTHNKANALERIGDGAQKTRAFGSKTSRKESRDIDYRLLHSVTGRDDDDRSQHDVSSIRTYGHKAPPWFSAEDVRLMRFLADAKVLRIKEVSYNNNKGSESDPSSFLLFESDTNVVVSPTKQRDKVCQCEQCGVIKRPVDTSEVFAFHLDRVLGLNRTLPAVSRSFALIHDGQPCAVVSWDPSLYPGGLVAARSTVVLTWKEYQSSLKQRCWHKNIMPKLDSGCSTIHHYEWSKVAVFDFLLQIYNRLDRSCCGFRPRQEDLCVEMGHHAECVNRDHVPLANIIHRADDPRHLVFTNNKGFFDRNEDNLDFRILEGIRELPEQAVGVLRTRKLRERLLQSLFMDQVYWESQGGRRGIDKLIDVIEKRVNVLHTYINAHGIKVIPMNA